MIIIGYPGVGKTKASKGNYKIIDLESSLFKDYTESNPFVVKTSSENCITESYTVSSGPVMGWAKIYTDVAKKLSEQGYAVCVSSHKEVCENLLNTHEPVVVCLPSVEKRVWTKFLRRRYLLSGMKEDSKEYRAYKRCITDYYTDINKLKDYGFDVWEVGPENIIIKEDDFENYKYLSDFLSEC